MFPENSSFPVWEMPDYQETFARINENWRAELSESIKIVDEDCKKLKKRLEKRGKNKKSNRTI